jgi:hypothetical protein
VATKAGQILHVANQFVIDRIQTGGVSSLNIPEEKIYETGNYLTVATVRDIPDLTFSIESLDVSTEIESLILNRDPTAAVEGDEFDFADSVPLDVVSPFKRKNGQFDIVGGVAIPYLTLESVTYRFGVRQNATQSFDFKGDGIYYVKDGTPKAEVFTLVNNTLSYNFAQTGDITFNDNGDTLNAVSVCVVNTTTNESKRLFFGSDYTNTSTGVTLLVDWFDEGYHELHVVYATTTANTFPQNSHQNVSVKPAAVRGQYIEVYISDGAATPALELWDGVQSIEATRRVNLEADEELGNTHYVAQDYDTAEVSGNLVVKPVDVDNMMTKIFTVANVPDNEMAGALTSTPLEMEMRIKHPDTGDVLKTIYVPDARIQVPAMQTSVQQKGQPTFNWNSDSGTMIVYQGERP